MIINLLLIAFFSFVLIKSTDLVVANFGHMVLKSGARLLALSGLILALATSLPEMFVAIVSGFEGTATLSLGNVLGANIANLSLVIGLAAIIGGEIKFNKGFVEKDMWMAFVAGLSPIVFLIDKSISRVDGLILICLYLGYQFLVFSEQSLSKRPAKEMVLPHRKLWHGIANWQTEKHIAWIFIGMAMMLVSAEIVVNNAKMLANTLHISIFVIGIIIVSVGTTLPELVMEIESLRKKKTEMALGNLLGSIAADSTLILGLAAFIGPFTIPSRMPYLVSILVFLLMFTIFYILIRSKNRLDRREGAILVGLYLVSIFLILKL
jgi:cation:H+ antiporter